LIAINKDLKEERFEAKTDADSKSQHSQSSFTASSIFS